MIAHCKNCEHAVAEDQLIDGLCAKCLRALIPGAKFLEDVAVLLGHCWESSAAQSWANRIRRAGLACDDQPPFRGGTGEYTPNIIGEKYATFLVQLGRCPKCQHRMVVERHRDYPFNAQAKRANFVIQSNVRVDGEYICQECKQAGRADFLCVLCGKRQPTDQIQEMFGDPPEFLCVGCYETVPAMIWEKKCEELWDAHQYDCS